MSPADLIVLARAAGVTGKTWNDWQCSDEVSAFDEAGGLQGGRGALLIRACEKAHAEGIREFRLAGGWTIAWTTAPADYDSMGTETLETVMAESHDGGLWHGKTLRRVMMDPKYAGYQAARYSSGLHPTWDEDPRVADARAAAQQAKFAEDERIRAASRAAGRTWLTTATDAELDAQDEDTCDVHGAFMSDVRAEQARRKIAADDAARAAEWERCLAIVKEGSIILDPGCDSKRGEFGVIRGRDAHVYYNVRIVRSWPDDVEHANVMGEGPRGPDNAGSLADVAARLSGTTLVPEISSGECFAHPGQRGPWRVVSVDGVPPRPVLDRIGHAHYASIRRVEAAGRVVWVGRPTYGETLVLDEKGHLVRAKKVLEAIQTSGVARDL